MNFFKKKYKTDFNTPTNHNSKSLSLTTSLQAEQLSIGYKNFVVVKDLSFKATTAELVALVGGNGSGKSTLLKTIAKLHPALSGTLLLNKKDLKSISQNQLSKHISLVLTTPIPTKNLTVTEVVATARHPYTNWLGKLNQQDKDAVENALKILEVENLKSKKCYQLSDGQLQRVMIARAIAQDTDIIILDEPTTHLDIYHKAKILKLLKHIATTTRRLVIFSTHEIELAMQLSDKMLILGGKSAMYGDVKKLIQQDCFKSLFPKNLIYFDQATNRFLVKND